MVDQCRASRPSKSLMSGFAPLRSNSSMRASAPTEAARCKAVDPSELWVYAYKDIERSCYVRLADQLNRLYLFIEIGSMLDEGIGTGQVDAS